MKYKGIFALPIIMSCSSCVLQNDPPRCDSKEVRSIVEKVLEKSFINGKGCAHKKGFLKWVKPVSNASECPVGVEKAPVYFPGDTTITYGDDFESSFTSYIIKSEIIPQDGLSVSCSFGLETRTISKNADYDEATKYKTLQLKLFKKDENGGTPYEYMWD